MKGAAGAAVGSAREGLASAYSVGYEPPGQHVVKP